MSLKIVVIAFLYFTKVSISAPIDSEESKENVENEENTQLLDYYQSRGEEAFEFKFELSDGQMREEKIHYDNLDSGIAVKGSYTIELEGGEKQTIYYISDTKGHRISINVPFDEIKVRPAPTRKPQNHSENRKRFNLAIDEHKLYEENRIDENQRQGRIQASRKIDIPKVEVKKSKAEDVAKPVEEVVEEVKTAIVKVEDKIKSEDDPKTEDTIANDEIQTEDDDKPEEQVDEEEKPEHDDGTKESAKDDDYDEK